MYSRPTRYDLLADSSVMYHYCTLHDPHAKAIILLLSISYINIILCLYEVIIYTYNIQIQINPSAYTHI